MAGLKIRDEYNVPGIPVAPCYGKQKVVKAVDIDYMIRKKKLEHRLPFYTKEEILRRKHPYYVILMHEMMEEGYEGSVKELNTIFRIAEKTIAKENKNSGTTEFAVLISNKEKVFKLANILKVSEDFETQEIFETAAVLRRDMGQNLMKEGNVWLAKHFLYEGLRISERGPKCVTRDRLQAEIHCLLAFIARDNSENLEIALEAAVNHLALCRSLSKDQSWHFKPRILSIRLKKPIALHGLREDYEIIDAATYSLYMVATLLEHEMMLGLANQILHSHKYPSDQDLSQAIVFADNALRLAFEVHNGYALSSALLRIGIVLRHTGDNDDAIRYFYQLANHSELTGDNETYGIAQHNIALCHMAKHESMEALEYLIRQKETADIFSFTDLQADALEEIGLILLQEGQLWEAEEAYASAYEGFSFINTENQTNEYHSHSKKTFVMWGISAGHHLWSRFAGLARSENYADLCSLIEWKSRRTPLKKVDSPNYEIDLIENVFVPYHLDTYQEAQKSMEDEESLAQDIEEDIFHEETLDYIKKGSSANLKAREEYMSDLNHGQIDILEKSSSAKLEQSSSMLIAPQTNSRGSILNSSHLSAQSSSSISSRLSSQSISAISATSSFTIIEEVEESESEN